MLHVVMCDPQQITHVTTPCGMRLMVWCVCSHSASWCLEAQLIFELVILAHVLLVLALFHLSATLIHRAVLLEFGILEHAC